MALSFSQTYTSNSTITIPASAQSISISIAGASGGAGGNDGIGNDGGSFGGSGGPGRFGSFTLPTITSSRNLSLNIGKVGSDGPSDSTAGTPGSGGSGVASGGKGGRSGPSGSSGAGGGGGGASGVYDSSVGAWIIVAGGGGGGGGASFPDVPGLNGNDATGWSRSGGTVSSITNGGAGENCPTDGGGGGGGGGGASGGGGGANGFDVTLGNTRAQGGGGGGSGYRSSACTWTGATSSYSGNGYITVSYTVSEPTISFSLDSSSICRGSSATLTWNVTGNVSSVSINQGIGSVATSGSRSVSPSSTTTYTITATGVGGTTTKTVTLTVYQPTSTNLTVDSSAIIRGQCTTLRWTTTGDATAATINQGIGSVNINGNRQICPTETITYTINVSGICTNSSDSVTLTVYQPPTVKINGPVSINYGQQGTLSYEATEVDISLKLSPVYNYKNGSLSGSMFDINLPLGKTVSELIETQIPYNDFGPFSVTYVIVATGNGGQESDQINIPINVDETPTNFLIPESKELLKDQAPIYTPDAIVTSYEIVINDIDIPVEVKSDKPILIDVNNQDDWKPIREL